ncbi:MAG: TAXI family TRAP transporter solute-binding subunit [Spirochaetia bacterium]|nr:TAXI family TRAP transporter solute-binding subunit [Spirochaetia bacterium]
MKKFFRTCVILIAILMLTTACSKKAETTEVSSSDSSAPVAAPAPQKKFLQIKTSAIGGTWHACGAVWAKLISENTPYIGVNSASPGLEFETMQKLKEGTVDLGFAGTSTAYYGWKGGVIWEEPIDLVALFATQPGILNFVGIDKPGINTLKDLKGKTIATYPVGNYWGDMVLEILALHGVTEENSRIMRIMKNDSARMLADGQVDCIVHKFGYGHGTLKQLAASRKIKFIEGDPDIMKAYLEKNKFFKTVPFGEEFGVANAEQLVSNYVAITMASLPDEIAYEVTKIWFENKDYLNKTLPSIAPYINWDDPTDGVTIPFHPGAIKYFKEVGLWHEK